jgi:hypothetical protein
MDVSDKAFNTYWLLKNASFLNGSDADIEMVCKELAEWFKERPQPLYVNSKGETVYYEG